MQPCTYNHQRIFEMEYTYIGYIYRDIPTSYSYDCSRIPESADEFYQLSLSDCRTMVDRMSNIPICVEHLEKHVIGHVTDSYIVTNTETKTFDWIVEFALSDLPKGRKAAEWCDSLLMYDLSLQHNRSTLKPIEVSLCFKGARDGTKVIFKKEKIKRDEYKDISPSRNQVFVKSSTMSSQATMSTPNAPPSSPTQTEPTQNSVAESNQSQNQIQPVVEENEESNTSENTLEENEQVIIKALRDIVANDNVSDVTKETLLNYVEDNRVKASKESEETIMKKKALKEAFEFILSPNNDTHTPLEMNLTPVINSAIDSNLAHSFIKASSYMKGILEPKARENKRLAKKLSHLQSLFASSSSNSSSSSSSSSTNSLVSASDSGFSDRKRSSGYTHNHTRPAKQQKRGFKPHPMVSSLLKQYK